MTKTSGTSMANTDDEVADEDRLEEVMASYRRDALNALACDVLAYIEAARMVASSFGVIITGPQIVGAIASVLARSLCECPDEASLERTLDHICASLGPLTRSYMVQIAEREVEQMGGRLN